MPFTHTPFGAGVMDWTTIATENAAFRSWVNQIPIGDLAAASIRRENLVRPNLQGFPLDGSEGGLQQAFGSSYGLLEPTAMKPPEWGSRRRRLACNPFKVSGYGDLWRFPIGKTLRLLRASDVEVHITFEYQTRADPPGGTAGAFYPDGLGSGNRCGYFSCNRLNRSDLDDNEFAGGIMHAYSLQPGGAGATGGPNHTYGHVCWIGNVAVGVYDFQLVYNRNSSATGAADLYQLDISRVQVDVEVL